ncbi:MAG: cation:proton antiporter, partial [Actinobacteria bacterium]|nr:cation:proton antiporter [Actinomycetota bacterium]
ALSGPVQHRAGALIGPLRDLFAATFFLFFSFQLRPSTLLGAAVPGLVLAALGIVTKLATGSVACAPLHIGRRGRLRAGAALAARGEFSIVIASLGAATADGEDLGAVAAAFVLMTAVVAPVMAKLVDRPSTGAQKTMMTTQMIE